MSLLARQNRPAPRRRLVPFLLAAVWIALALWCSGLVSNIRGYTLELSLLVGACLGAVGALGIMLVRARNQTDHLDLTATTLRTIIETAQDVIFVVDAEGRKVFANEAARRVYGYAPSEMCGMPAAELLASENRERDSEVLAGVLEGESIVNYEATAIRKDGSRVPLLYNAAPLRDKLGRVIGCMGTASDISGLKGMQQQLLRNERQQALGTLASGVVHDFNNLLTVILGQSEHALEDENIPDQAARRLRAIQETAERASRMVTRLLVFTESATSSRTRIDLAAAVLRMESFLADLLGERGSLTITTMDAPVPVSADWGQIEQIVMNLVLNARDAIDDDGQVHVRIRQDDVSPARAAELGIRSGPWACIEIRDDGAGMDPATCDRIFEPFFTTKASGHGTGLGLAGVQGIVQQHEGSIDVQTEPGTGTSMTVHLPLAPDSVPASAY